MILSFIIIIIIYFFKDILLDQRCHLFLCVVNYSLLDIRGHTCLPYRHSVAGQKGESCHFLLIEK